MSEIAVAAAKAAKHGADSTKTMAAHAGRSSYVNQEALLSTCDPGALAVSAWMSAIAGKFLSDVNSV